MQNPLDPGEGHGEEDALDLLGPYFSVTSAGAAVMQPQPQLPPQPPPPVVDATSEFIEQIVCGPVDLGPPHEVVGEWNLQQQQTMHSEPQQEFSAPFDSNPPMQQQSATSSASKDDDSDWLLGGATAEAAVAALTGGRIIGQQQHNGPAPAPPAQQQQVDVWVPDIAMILNEGNGNGNGNGNSYPTLPSNQSPCLAAPPPPPPQAQHNHHGTVSPQAMVPVQVRPQEPQNPFFATQPVVPNVGVQQRAAAPPLAPQVQQQPQQQVYPRSPTPAMPGSEPPVQKMRTARPAGPCDVSSRILPRVRLWAEERGGPAATLLHCSKESDRPQMGALLEPCPILPGSDRQRMETRVVVQKRCGVRNQDLRAHSEQRLTVCANHLKLLTTHFPVVPACQVCGVDVPAPQNGEDQAAAVATRTISAFQQDIFAPFFEGFLLGQALCKNCYRKITYCVAGRKNRTEHGFVRFMMHVGLLHKEKYDKWVEEQRPKHKEEEEEGGEQMPVGRKWSNVDRAGLQILPLSAVPPLR